MHQKRRREERDVKDIPRSDTTIVVVQAFGYLDLVCLIHKWLESAQYLDNINANTSSVPSQIIATLFFSILNIIYISA
jgi:hypothetical protein